MDRRQLFLHNLAQTSSDPLMLDIEKAEGVWLYTADGKRYMDLISGIAVSNTGHRHPRIVRAIKEQADCHLHLMVYGEYLQSPQLKLAKKISELLPESLSCTYFVNSGSEAVEGAVKLAKKYTGRSGMAAFDKAYHGSTHAALSLMGSDRHKKPFMPLLPDGISLNFNKREDLERIDETTACVLIEPVQGEAGVRKVDPAFAQALRQRCTQTGTLLVLDEVQTGMGRTGSMFHFEQLGIIPDILLLAKALGGGLPLGAFIASHDLMHSLNVDPELGHISTFGGHPLCCAAGLAAIEVLENENLPAAVPEKEALFLKLLRHKAIKEIRSCGLFLAVEFGSATLVREVIKRCLAKGVVTDWFLFCDSSLRIAPPLLISKEEIHLACDVIIQSINEATS